MKNKISKIFLAIIINFFFLYSYFFTFAKSEIGKTIYINPENLIKNSGFEEWNGSLPKNWIVLDFESPPASKIEKEDVITFKGNYSIKLYNFKNGGAKALVQEITNLIPDATYRLSFWASSWPYNNHNLGIFLTTTYINPSLLPENIEYWNFNTNKWELAPIEILAGGGESVFKFFSLSNFFDNYSLSFTGPKKEKMYLVIYSKEDREKAAYLDEVVLHQIIDDSISPSTLAPKSGKYSAPKTITLKAVDNTGGSGVDKIYYTLDGSNPTTNSLVYTSPIKITRNTVLKFFAQDKAGNKEAIQTREYYIDQAKLTTKKPKNNEILLTKKKLYTFYDFNFSFLNFSKKTTKNKKFLTIKIRNKYPPQYFNAKKRALKKYWQIKTNLNTFPNENQFKLKLNFKYSDKELKALKKKNKKIKEGNLFLKYYNPQIKTWNNLSAEHNRKKNVFTINFHTFFFSNIYFAIGEK